MRTQRRGYTLLEVILVCALLIIVMAIALPSTVSSYDHYKLYAASDTIRGAWASARSHAVEEGRPYRFAVMPGKSNFRVAPDDSAYWGGSPPSREDNDYYDYEDTLPKGIPFSINGGGSSSGQWQTIAHFEADGTTHKDGTEAEDTSITLSFSGQRDLVVILKAMTGTSTVRKDSINGVRP